MTKTAPTILIAVHHGFSIRYLLQTDLLPGLLRRGARVVIVAGADAASLAPFRAMDGVSVEIVADAECEAWHRRRPLDAVLRQVRFFTYAGHVSTADVLWRISAREALEAPGLSPFRRAALRVRWAGYRLLARLLRASRLLRRALVRLESRRFPEHLYRGVLERHRPDLVVSSSLGTFDWDQYLMRAARARGIPVASVVLSWDNPTTRGYPGAVPDLAIAWTDTMKRELLELHDLAPERVVVAGVAHFDGYWRADPVYERAAFLRGLGADPARRTVFFATRSPNSYPWNPNIARALAEAAADGRLRDAQVVLRIHPLYYRRRNGELVYRKVLDAFEQAARDFPGQLVLNVPRFVSEEIDYAMPESEMELLARLLKAADAVVTVFSTINIEAAILDRPIVNACFEGLPLLYETGLRARFDIVADASAAHNARVVATGGVRLARTPAELVEAVAQALEQPDGDAAGRARIVANEAGPNRGRAGDAAAQALFEFAAGRA